VVRPGLAFWKNDHPWIILTDPLPPSGKVVCVNLTSFDAECKDDVCILYPSDYAWIKRPTAVAFSYARLFDIGKLEENLTKKILRLANPPDIPPITFAKIRQIAKTALDRDTARFL
jgi:hypothetical protein